MAFNELLEGLKDSYHGVGSKIKLFDADRVARPKLGRSPIQVETILGPEAHRILDPERMLVEKEVFAGRCRDDPVHLYGDKILGRSAKARAEFFLNIGGCWALGSHTIFGVCCESVLRCKEEW